MTDLIMYKDGEGVENFIKIIQIVFNSSDIKEMFLRNHWKSSEEPHGYPTVWIAIR